MVSSDDQNYEVVFECHCDLTQPGDQLCIIGSDQSFGRWNPMRAVELSTSSDRFPMWYSTPIVISTPPGDFEFKFVIRRGEATLWESCENRKMGTLLIGASELSGPNTIRCTYNIKDTSIHTKSHRDPSYISPNEDPLWSVLDNADVRKMSSVDMKCVVLDEILLQENSGACKSYRQKLQMCKSLIDKRVHPLVTNEGYVREAITFYSPPRLLIANEEHKLSTGAMVPFAMETVATIALYLGEVTHRNIPCYEDGQHYRPCSHANESKHFSIILRRLLSRFNHPDVVAESVSVSPTQNHRALNASSIIEVFSRAIFPLLTSFEPQFTTAQPLTRIRDIAHRNDIDHGLKQEIKTKLQNKLHRCAGPEDLATCEDFLMRFHQNPGMVNEHVLGEFNRFYSELKEFFMANTTIEKLDQFAVAFRSLASTIRDCVPDASEEDAKLCCRRLKVICAILAESLSNVGDLKIVDRLYDAIRDAVSGRRFLQKLCYALSSERAYESRDDIQVFAHLCMAIDIGVEAQVFSTLSTAENILARVSADDEKTENDVLHRLSSGLELSLDHCAMSGISKNDARSISKALQSWRTNWQRLVSSGMTVSARHTYLMFFRGLVRRVDALGEAYASSVLVSTHPVAFCLKDKGSAILNDTSRVAIYAEAFVRSSLIFQTTKLSIIAMEIVRRSFTDGLFETIVAGVAEGYILGLSSLVCLDDPDESVRMAINKLSLVIGSSHCVLYEVVPVILWIDVVDGDEEIGAIGRKLTALMRQSIPDMEDVSITGILVNHPVPSLSHLGVRARALEIPFSGIYDTPLGDKLKRQWEFQFISVDLSSVDESPFTAISPDSIGMMHRKEECSKVSLEMESSKLDDKFDQPKILAICDGMSVPFLPLEGGRWNPNQVGKKAMKCRDLMLFCSNRLAGMDASFNAPSSVCIPYSGLRGIIQSLATEKLKNMLKSYEEIACLDLAEEMARDIPEGIENLIDVITPHACQVLASEIVRPIIEMTQSDELTVMVRSSANCEDVSGLKTGAGLFDSFPVTMKLESKKFTLSSSVNFVAALLGVYASLYSPRSVRAWVTSFEDEKENRPISEVLTRLEMAVFVQPVIGPPSVCFVLHTLAPLAEIPQHLHSISKKPEDWIYAELAHGMGEILASAKYSGAPYCMLISKLKDENSGRLKTDYYFVNSTSFGVMIVPPDGRSGSLTSCVIANDMGSDPFFCDDEARMKYATAIAEIGCELEEFYDAPQDVEGFFSCDGKAYVVQSRPQPLKAEK
eukprot:GHVH01012273.1.p1 GENE.GHVH01012273.1~~GHVH01012273.1.p1  ORF type:complete len:1262 (+),score=180.23 GHVH01012273.1:164-3949(+)